MMVATEAVRIETPKIEIVPASANSLAYVLHTWGKGVQDRLADTDAIPAVGFLSRFAQLQANIIRKSRVLTAMEGTKIIGFIVCEMPSALHWIYVRNEYGQKGHAKAMLDAAGLSHTYVTSWTHHLRRIRLAHAPYTPFWLRT